MGGADMPVERSPVPLPALLAEWARIVDRLEHAPHDPAHVFTHDILVRHEIAARLRGKPATAETREMLADLDGQLRAFTEASAMCVLGEERAAQAGWTPTREWYLWRRPPG
jgi:hypothetical protein